MRAAGALALSSITSSLWIWTGERNLRAVRKKVYAAVTQKDMVWFGLVVWWKTRKHLENEHAECIPIDGFVVSLLADNLRKEVRLASFVAFAV